MKNINKRFTPVLKYFSPTLEVIIFYLKYSFFYIIINLIFAPLTGIFQTLAPPVTLFFVFFIKKIRYRIIIGIPLLLVFFVDYMRANYYLSVYQIISSFSFSQILVSIYPAILIFLASSLSMFISSKTQFRKLLKTIQRI